MSLNTSKKAIIKHRREQVARLRLRGLSQREIALKLTMENVANGTTGYPVSLGTINSDIQALVTDWREQATADTAALKGQVLAELREARRVAWEKDQLTTVLRALAQEVQLLGLQNQYLHIPGPTGESISPAHDHVGDLSEQINVAMARASEEERAALAEKMEVLLSEVASLIASPQTTSEKL